MKKLLLIAMSLLTSLIIVSCRGWEGETEFFIWERRHTSAAITGLTYLGKKQEFLVIPSYIEGRRVTLGRAGNFINASRGSVESENLQRVYFPEVLIRTNSSSFFRNVPNLTHIFSLNDSSIFRSFRFIYWGLREQITLFSPWEHFPSFNGETVYTTHGGIAYRVANVEFIYNFEDAPNEGLFFIDDWQNELIRFRPNDPMREGYKFKGWFREPEGINKWDFESDIVKVEDTFEITRLYASWIEN